MFRYLFVVSIAISSFVLVASNFHPKCSETTECYYVQRLEGNMTNEMETSRDKCRKLDIGGRKWNLIEFENRAEYDWMKDNFIYKEEMAFWIGLRRENVTATDEACTRDQWKDHSKWRWMMSKTSEFLNFSWHLEQPQNDYFCKENGTEMSDCVVGLWGPPSLNFYSSVCDLKLKKFFRGAAKDKRSMALNALVCESPPLRSVESITRNLLEQQPTSESQRMPSTWVWVVLGIICAVALISVVAVVGTVIARRRRGRGESRGRKGTSGAKRQEKEEDSMSVFVKTVDDYSYYQTYVMLKPKEKKASTQVKVIK